jgi:aryl-alcohol dehydrogenase-like predicted oxidoreductase
VPPTAATFGTTETMIGTWLQRNPTQREKVVLASKIAGPGRPYIRGGAPNNRAGLLEAIEGSLKRLQTTYLDLYQLHWPNRPNYHFQNYFGFTPASNGAAQKENLHEILSTLGDLIKAGKIRHIGLSDDSAWGLCTYQHLAEKHSLPRLVSIQNEYSLICRRDDTDVAETCQLENISYLPWSPLAMGVLTGKYQNGARPAGTRVHLAGNGTEARLTTAALAATAEYIKLAEELNITPAQLAIAFTLHRPFVASTIIGATTMAQLQEDIAAAAIKLPASALARIESIHRQYPIPF